MTKLLLGTLVFVTVRLAAADESRPQPPPQGERPPARKPPQEAIDACANLAVDAACSFTIRDQTISGTCKTLPDNASQLACRPDRPPPRPDGSGSDAPPPPPR